MKPVQIAQFFVVLPLALGLFLAAARIGLNQFVSIGHHIAYTMAFSLLSWVCYGLGSKLTAIVMRPWKPPLMLVLILGYAVGGFGMWWPLRDLLNAGFEPFLTPESAFGPFWPPAKGNLVGYTVMTVQGLAGWVGLNWLDFRIRGVPRFGFMARPARSAAPQTEPSAARDNGEADAASTPVSAGPRLRDRLPDELSDAEIFALEAEEHYTRIHTSKGKTMVLLRFSDAMVEMEPQPGLQVHRSFWVSKEHVEHLQQAGKRLRLSFSDGLVVPVSRSYRVLVKNAGFATTNPADDRDNQGIQ